MSLSFTIFVGCMFLLVGVLVYFRLTRENRYENIRYLEHLSLITEFLERIKTLDDYITWVQRDQLKEQYAEAARFFRNKGSYYKEELRVEHFNSLYADFNHYIQQYNKSYVTAQMEKLKGYFDNIEGKRLDDQQREAVVTDEYSNLIIAGAGSGKTLTILGKVQYLIEQKGIPPEQILLLSFTRKTVEELNERLKKIGLGTQATTFHRLGYNTIKQYHTAIPAVANENTLGAVVKDYFKNDIYNDPEALNAYIQYVACYMNVPEENDSYDSLGEKADTEKGLNLKTLRSQCEPLNKVAKAALNTMQGEKVKSVEELIIANFLYLNGIEYEYERPYPFEAGMYRPDFFLPAYNIYLEHFGVDEQDQAKWLTPFNEEKYVEAIKWKREIHQLNQTKLLETYSYYNRNNVLLEKLRLILEAEQVVFKPRDVKSIYSKVVDNEGDFGTEIFKLIESFINLSKSRQLNGDGLLNLYAANKLKFNRFMRERQELFLKFVLPILDKYDRVLLERNEIDFNDMINKATDLIKTHSANYEYRYIIVDEYQDISFSRFNLIKEIRERSGARLVCVGDDWQSIYRFAGSDVSLFSHFGKYVGPYAKLFIEQTYRNAQSLINITTRFIQRNPGQIVKAPRSKKEPLLRPIKFVSYTEEKVADVFINEIRYLVEKYGSKSILVLGRHSFDLNPLIRLSPDARVKYIERTDRLEVKGFEQIDIKFLTVHKSKGTEADNVILLNLQNDLLGFPNKMTDDPILSLLLNDTEDYRFAEERRLFYVALTRTRNEVVALLPPDISVFAEELLTDTGFLLHTSEGKTNTTNCPYCKTGKLLVRQNPSNASNFLGCSHYPVCDQTFANIEILDKTILCPDCKSGFMTRKEGQYGAFLGCTNYPKCRNMIKLK